MNLKTPAELRSLVPTDADLRHISPDLRQLAVPIVELLQDPRNARRHPEKNLTTIRSSFLRFGQRQALTVNRRNLVTEAGNGRLQVAQALGWQYIAVSFEDDDAVTATAYGLVDNQSALTAEWDQEVLSGLLVDLDRENFDIGQLGFEPAEVEKLLDAADTEKDGDEQSDPDEAPVNRADELQKEWQTERGQVWEIPSKSVPGMSHRVVCGDCREPADIALLLSGRKINVAFTSPPYASQRKYDEESGFKPIKPDAYVDWFEAVQANVKENLAADGSWFVNIKEHCEDGQRHLYVNDLSAAHVRRWGWRFVDELCWRDTRNGMPGKFSNRFKDAWERIFHFSTQSGIKFDPIAVGTESDQCFDYDPDTKRGKDRNGMKTGTPAGGMKTGIALPSNVLEIPASSDCAEHSAGFPVALPTFFIKAFSDAKDLIFDPFLGSGTTMIAAEREGRIALGTEISPKYVAVILERARKQGLEPRKIGP